MPKPLSAVRADRANDNKLISPADTLRDCLNDIEEGRINPNKLVIIQLYDGQDDPEAGDQGPVRAYDFNLYMSNIASSEVVSLCEAAKIRALQQMWVIPGDEE